MAKKKTEYFTFPNLDYKEQKNSIYTKLMMALKGIRVQTARSESTRFINKLLDLSSTDFNKTITDRFDAIFNLKQLEDNQYIILPDNSCSYSFIQIDTGRKMLREISCFNLAEHYVAAISQTLPGNKFTLTVELYKDDNYTTEEIFTASLEDENMITKTVKNAFNSAERNLLSSIACHHKN